MDRGLVRWELLNSVCKKGDMIVKISTFTIWFKLIILWYVMSVIP